MTYYVQHFCGRSDLDRFCSDVLMYIRASKRSHCARTSRSAAERQEMETEKPKKKLPISMRIAIFFCAIISRSNDHGCVNERSRLRCVGRAIRAEIFIQMMLRENADDPRCKRQTIFLESSDLRNQRGMKVISNIRPGW